MLHGYILRELLKTFGLTLAALTVLFTLGGGLFNTLRFEGINPRDLMTFLPLLIPIAVTLSMPPAALFAACIVYGRLAADNELLAARAAGINIHRLFLAAVLLSVFVASFSLLFGDLVIPDFVRRLEHYARANLRDIAHAKLQSSGYVHYERRNREGEPAERFLLTARNARIPTKEALRKARLPIDDDLSYLLVEDLVMLQVASDGPNDRLARYASAEYGLCCFDTGSQPLEATIYVNRGRGFDMGGRALDLGQQPIGPIALPLKFPRRSAMVDLRTLARWKQQPWLVDRFAEQVASFRGALQTVRLFGFAHQRIEQGGGLTLVDTEGQTWQITAAEAVEERGALALHDAVIQQLASEGERPLYYEAPVALLQPERALSGQTLLGLHLRERAGAPVRLHNPRSSRYDEGEPRTNETLDPPMLYPEAVIAELAKLPDAALLDPQTELALPENLAERREKLIEEAGALRRKMGAVMHFRLGFASSALVTVIMAAALGVTFRGARALAAFGLSCLPYSAVLLVMVMARQMGEKPATEYLGPLLTWGGLAAVAVIDVVILRVGVRR